MSSPHPSALGWARFFGHELGPLDRWRLRRHLASCPACAGLHAAMVEERRVFLASPARLEQLALLTATAARLGAREARPAWRPLPWLLGGSLAATAAALALVVLSPSAGLEELRAKGGDTLSLVVQRAGGPARLGESCAAGDRLTARFRTDHRQLLLLERDGAGAVQQLYQNDPARPLPAGEGVTPTSWVLDDQAGEECFAGFFSDTPVEPRAAIRALEASPHAPVLPGAVVRVQCCLKGAPR
jgi:Putative zinc-finger